MGSNPTAATNTPPHASFTLFSVFRNPPARIQVHTPGRVSPKTPFFAHKGTGRWTGRSAEAQPAPPENSSCTPAIPESHNRQCLLSVSCVTNSVQHPPIHWRGRFHHYEHPVPGRRQQTRISAHSPAALSSSSSAAISGLTRRISVSSSRSFERRFMLPYQIKALSITA